MSDQTHQLLSLFSQPAFLANEERVLWHNAAASTLVAEGMPISELLGEQADILSAWGREGVLQLPLAHGCTASVCLQGGAFLFVLTQQNLDIRSSATAVLNASATLRRPLHNLLNAANSLFEQIDTDEAKAPASQLNHSIYQLMRLCGQMSDGSRLLLNQFPAHRSLVNLQLFFDHFVQQVEPLIEASGKKLVYDGLKQTVQGLADDRLLERAMFNLLSNALTYTPVGGTVSIRLHQQQDRLLISVSDNGNGISDDVIASVFDRFADRPIGDSHWGLGYGLSIVRQIARLHDGTMMLHSDGTHGTSAAFSISLRRDTATVHSPSIHYDYCGGLNHALVELSDALDSVIYDPQEI